MGIRNLMLKIAMHHLVEAIPPSLFTESLIKRPTKNMEELRNRATKFMQIEEHIDYHRNHQFEVPTRGKKQTKEIDLCLVGVITSGKTEALWGRVNPNFETVTDSKEC